MPPRVDANEVGRAMGVSADRCRKAAGARWLKHVQLTNSEANQARERKRLALDLEDLAHMTNRGDVDEATWLRVCRGRFQSWPANREQRKRTLERWKRRIRDKGIPMHLVDDHRQDSAPKLMRFDWPAVLRWTRHVLD